MNRNEDAIDDCKKSIEADPKYVRAYARLAEAQANLKLFEDALHSIEEAIDLEDNPTYKSKRDEVSPFGPKFLVIAAPPPPILCKFTLSSMHDATLYLYSLTPRFLPRKPSLKVAPLVEVIFFSFFVYFRYLYLSLPTSLSLFVILLVSLSPLTSSLRFYSPCESSWWWRFPRIPGWFESSRWHGELANGSQWDA